MGVPNVSHGLAPLRSPKGGARTFNVDELLFNVQYLSLPRHLGSIQIQRGSTDEVAELAALVPRPFDEEDVWAIVAGTQRYLVVATQIKVRESQQSIFDSPFADVSREAR